jgi:Uma2 family endonuclease
LKKKLQNCKHCEVIKALDWRITSVEDNNTLQTDCSVICNDFDQEYITDAPILIFEILSPSTIFKDRHIKYEIYESQGVKYYVIVDSEKNLAEVFELKNMFYVKIIEAKNETVHFDLDSECKIEFNFSEIWA